MLVSCKNVANAVAVVGVVHLGATCLFLHPTLNAAIAAFQKLPISFSEEDDFNAVVAGTTPQSKTIITSPAAGGPPTMVLWNK